MSKFEIFVKGKDQTLLIGEEDYLVVKEYDWYLNPYTGEILSHIGGTVRSMEEVLRPKRKRGGAGRADQSV